MRLNSRGGCYIEALATRSSRPWLVNVYPPREAVDCKDPMGDPAFKTCRYGKLYANHDGTRCICDVFGDPLVFNDCPSDRAENDP